MLRGWRKFLAVLFVAALIFLYLDDRRYADNVRPPGFSTDTPEGSVFKVRLRDRLDLTRARPGQTLRFVPVEPKPYGSAADAMLPAEAILYARVDRISSRKSGRRVVIFVFERLSAGGRTVPISAFLTVKKGEQIAMEESRREGHGTVGAFIARSAKDDPFTVIAGYLSGTYFGSFWSRQTEAPLCFFSNESGPSIPASVELRVQLHRRAFIPR